MHQLAVPVKAASDGVGLSFLVRFGPFCPIDHVRQCKIYWDLYVDISVLRVTVPKPIIDLSLAPASIRTFIMVCSSTNDVEHVRWCFTNKKTSIGSRHSFNYHFTYCFFVSNLTPSFPKSTESSNRSHLTSASRLSRIPDFSRLRRQ